MDEPTYPDVIELTHHETILGWALRHHTDQAGHEYALLYASGTLDGKNTDKGYYHCHLPAAWQDLRLLMTAIDEFLFNRAAPSGSPL